MPADRPIIHGNPDGAMPRHILKRFSFDERKLGNVEEIPMYWQQRKGLNLPHFNKGTFDPAVGHDAPPSFRLKSITESVAFTYHRSDIPVEPGCRYLISSWIRTENLRKSRAYISVAYLARDLKVIEQTEINSPVVGGAEQNGQWCQVELPTLEAPRAARFLQISVWLAQPELHPERAADGPRPILTQDTNGVAWFDDLEVTHLLPVASIRTLNDTPVFAANQPAQILGPQVNPAHFGLACRISITDDDGKVYYTAASDPHDLGQTPPGLIRLDDLPCGLYTAKLTVLSQSRQIAQQEVRFAKLPDLPPTASSPIGICLDESSLRAVQATMAGLHGIQAGCVKIPIWSSSTTGSQISGGQGACEELLKRVLADGLEPIGVFAAPPADLATNALPSQRTLVDFFAADRQIWQPCMALSLTHYADVVRLWQIGQDGQTDLALDGRYPAAADLVAQQIITLIDGAQVALAWPAMMAYPAALKNVKRQSISLPSAIRPEQIREYIKEHSRDGKPLWATVWPLDDNHYAATVRRTDLAKRIVFALAARAETVFVPQPWTVEQVGDRAIVAPTVEYTVLAMLSRVLAGRHYAGSFEWTGGAVFHIFADQNDAVLIAWNDQVVDPAEPDAKVNLYLGQKISAFDLRGRPWRVEPGQTLAIGPEPIVIVGTDDKLARLRSQFTIEPRQVASGLRQHQQTVTLINPYPEPINGTIRLRAPEGWEITPSRLSLSLEPGKTMREKVQIHIPYNEPVGPKTIYADLSIDSRRLQQLSIPVTLDLQLPGIETYAFSDTTHGDVVIRHVLTNRTTEELNFIGSILLPTMGRQERLFLHLRPGQTMIKEYVIPRDQIAGQSQLHLSLREINGSRLLNQLVEIF